MNKGIVMEINESNIIVMTSGGRFDKLPRESRVCEVGEEILYAEALRPRFKIPPLAIGSGLIAAMVLCFILITGLRGTTANAEVVAYVSIDINPSIEIGIDSQEIVRELRGINSDGVALIASISYKGKKLDEVTSAILDRAEQGALGKGEGDIVVSSTVVQSNSKINDETIADKLREQVAKHIEQAHPTQVKNYAVTAFAAPQEIREQAKVSGVSAGKYAVYLNALNNGTRVSRDDIQNLSIHQLASDNGGISKLVNPANPITKSALKELLAEEKSGKLAERLQEKEDSKSGKTDNNKGKSNANDKNNSGRNDDKNKGSNDNKNINQNDAKNKEKNNRNDGMSESDNRSSSWNDLINRNNPAGNSKNGSGNNNGNNKDDSKNNQKKQDDKKQDDKNKDDRSKDVLKDDSKNNDGKRIDAGRNNNDSNNDQRGESASSDRPANSVKPSPTAAPSPTPKSSSTPKPRTERDSDSKDDKRKTEEKDNQKQEAHKETNQSHTSIFENMFWRSD